MFLGYESKYWRKEHVPKYLFLHGQSKWSIFYLLESKELYPNICLMCILAKNMRVWIETYLWYWPQFGGEAEFFLRLSTWKETFNENLFEQDSIQVSSTNTDD